MPDLFDALGDLDALDTDDTVVDETSIEEPTPASKKTTTTKVDTRAALEKVFTLLGRPSTPAGAGTAPQPGSAVPSARARIALEEFAQCATIEDLNAKQVNLKLLARDLFDWDTPAQTRATGNVVKAMGRALLATGEDGTSRFPQAVEMLGFASAAAPLLQPDRLARLIDEAPKVDSAFAPDRYTMRLTGALRTVLLRYPEQRRETLLVSLWHAAHDGRWWDITSGISKVSERRRPRGVNAEQAAADAEVVREALAGNEAGTPEANATLGEMLLKERIPYNAGVRGLVAALPSTPQLRDGLLTASERMRAGHPVYPDMALLISVIPWASPAERPESPIAWLVRTLTAAMLPDPETGEVMLEDLPEKPRKWAELYPEADLTGFPHPPQARLLDGVPVPGFPTVLAEVVKNAAELAENRDYMGNCTYGYKSRMEDGAYVLFKLWDGADCYNASMVAGNVGDAWRIGEVNSRFNRGQVPAHVRAAAESIAAGLPPRTPAAERRNREARQYRANA